MNAPTSTTWREHGQAEIQATWNAGGDIAGLLNRLGNTQTTASQEAFAGAIAGGVSILVSLRKQKAIGLTGPTASLFDEDGEPYNRFINNAILGRDEVSINAALQVLVNYLASVKAALPNARVSPMSADKKAPIDVRIVGDLPALQAEITAMPTRETTTEVTRDKAGNILSTVQTERDAA